MKFRVLCSETFTRSVVVVADSGDKAVSEALQAYREWKDEKSRVQFLAEREDE